MRVSLAEAISLLQQGEVVAIPTETVYGLAANARDELAIAKIFATKQRPSTNPLIVHLSAIEEVESWAQAFPPIAKRLAQRFWPGPLTLVLPAREDVLDAIRAQQPTVAVRVPAHPLARDLIASSGLALAAPSANKYTQLSPTTADHVEQGLGKDIPVVDGGACTVGIESTIVSVSGNEWQLLRHGMIAATEIEKIAGKPELPISITRPKAPGQHALHYSPRTPSVLFSDTKTLTRFLSSQIDVNKRYAIMTFQPLTDIPKDVDLLLLPEQPERAAEQLYACLHRMDQMGLDKILIVAPPTRSEWAAIHDRLQRATFQD